MHQYRTGVLITSGRGVCKVLTGTNNEAGTRDLFSLFRCAAGQAAPSSRAMVLHVQQQPFAPCKTWLNFTRSHNQCGTWEAASINHARLIPTQSLSRVTRANSIKIKREQTKATKTTMAAGGRKRVPERRWSGQINLKKIKSGNRAGETPTPQARGGIGWQAGKCRSRQRRSQSRSQWARWQGEGQRDDVRHKLNTSWLATVFFFLPASRKGIWNADGGRGSSRLSGLRSGNVST